MKSLALLAALVAFSAADFAFAGSATWSATPATNDWNTADNWNPATVPNAQTDIATFATSSVTQLSLSSSVSLGGMVFNPGADSFSLTTVVGSITFYGAGVVNNSGQTQSFDLAATADSGGIAFNNSASAGVATSYTIGAKDGISFNNSATAGSANFVVQGTAEDRGVIYFFGSSSGGRSTSGNGTFTVLQGGFVIFGGATAGNATFDVAGGIVEFTPDGTGGQSIIECSDGGAVYFGSSGDTQTVQATARGATGRKGLPGLIEVDTYLPSAGTFVVEGGTGSQSPGGELLVAFEGTLSEGTVTVTGGKSGGLGGTLLFRGKSDGGTARLSLSGNAVMDFSRHDLAFGTVSVGSIEGKGSVILGAIPLLVGANGLSATFSGVIEDGKTRLGIGSLVKVGNGTLVLSGASAYEGGTTVSAGSLSVTNLSGSATGTGPVTVSGGTLGGSGIIAGAVTVGPAVLWPSVALSDPAALTVQGSLTFNSGSTDTCRLNNKKKQSDMVTASGVTIASGAQFNLVPVAAGQLPPGMTFIVLNNVAATPINGLFANLADGATISSGQNTLQASYEGGDGNDLTLTVQ